MIHKVFHYCWFGKGRKPKEFYEYLASWKKYGPEYEIQEWNETNFDISDNRYCWEAYQVGKWAFVSDYARLKIMYKYGGIYLDTDVELLRPLTPLIDQFEGFVGYQNPVQINTGLGFAAAERSPCVKAMLDIYNKRAFLREDGTMDLTPCPVANTVGLKNCGMLAKDSGNIQRVMDVAVLPVDYLNPFNVDTGKLHITEHTFSVHHYAATWHNKSARYRQRLKALVPDFLLMKRAIYISLLDIERMDGQINSILSSQNCESKK